MIIKLALTAGVIARRTAGRYPNRRRSNSGWGWPWAGGQGPRPEVYCDVDCACSCAGRRRRRRCRKLRMATIRAGGVSARAGTGARRMCMLWRRQVVVRFAIDPGWKGFWNRIKSQFLQARPQKPLMCWRTFPLRTYTHLHAPRRTYTHYTHCAHGIWVLF